MGNIKDFIKRFTIEPLTDIEPNFKLSKTLDIDAYSHKGCFNCGDESNNKNLPSESWTDVQYCWKCNHLNVVYFADRMGGVYTDTVECFTDKEEKVKISIHSITIGFEGKEHNGFEIVIPKVATDDDLKFILSLRDYFSGGTVCNKSILLMFKPFFEFPDVFGFPMRQGKDFDNFRNQIESYFNQKQQ